MGEKLKGIEYLINFWFGDLDENYRIELYIGCEGTFNQKVNYYLNKQVYKPLAERVAKQYVYKKLIEIANIR